MSVYSQKWRAVVVVSDGVVSSLVLLPAPEPACYDGCTGCIIVNVLDFIDVPCHRRHVASLYTDISQHVRPRLLIVPASSPI